MQSKISLLFVWLFAFSVSFAQNNATIKEYKKTFTTYPYSDPNPVPDFGKIYPYFRFDGFTDKPQQKEWKVVELENDYIKVMVLPEIGGKIWAAIEKSTNQPFIYYNHAVKFRDVAMRGPWTSGGIEANYGIIGHTPNSASPVDYLIQKKEDGSVSCYIAWLDLLSRTNWTIEINLPKDKAYFTTHSTWHNNTATEQPYYHWMNVGIKTKGNLQFIYPGTRYIGHEGEYADWPVNKSNGKHIDFYEENNFGTYKSYHVFGKRADFFGAYWHDDDFGMARFSNYDDKPGRKIWIWGLSQQGMIWEKLLTDKDGQYAEIQSGRLFNQNAEGSTLTPFKHLGFEPYATDEWTEYWFPVLKTKGFVKANDYGALNVRQEGGWLKISFSPVQAINDVLIVKEKNKNIYSKPLKLSPLQLFTDSIKVTANADDIVVTIGDGKFVYEANPQTDVINRPVDAPANFDWNSAYGHYVAGKEYMDQRLYRQAEEQLKQSVAMDSNFLPSLNQMAELYYRNLEYDKALLLARRALSISTHDGESNYYYGLVNTQLGNIADAKDGFELAALTPSYRGAAYTELAKIYITEKNYKKAEEYAGKALYYNAGNITAYKLKAVIARKTGKKEAALQAIEAIDQLDPLNHFAAFEKFLTSKTDADKNSFVSTIQSESPYQTFLEMTAEYYTLHNYEEALQLLELSPGHALVFYWKDFLNHKSGKTANDGIAKGNAASPAFVLPFRSEEAEMLQWVIGQTGEWQPKYYLALLYRDRNRIDVSKKLFAEIGDKPTVAFFYASRASILPENAEQDLLKANQLDKNEWRYVKALGEFYIDKGDAAKALSFVEPFYKSNTGNYIMGMLYAKGLAANKKYAAAGKLLSTLNIIPFEGATEGREVFRETMLMQAIQNIKAKKYNAVPALITKAKSFPDNLGSGKPYDADIDSRLEDYLIGIYYEKTGKKTEADKLFQQVAAYPEEKKGNRMNVVLQAWALQKTGNTDAAKALIEKVVAGEKNKKIAEVIQTVFNKTSSGNKSLSLIDEVGAL